MLDPELILDFPILDRKVNGCPLVYLDNAATTQKPRQVLDTARHYYEALNSNIHRGAHALARAATAEFEKARISIASHINAREAAEVIFTSGATDGVNLVANILALTDKIGRDDEILISGLEHHSNIVPWQMLCQRTGARLRVIPVLDDGTLDRQAFHSLLSPRTRLLALTWISNAFGTVNPVREMVAAARKAGAMTLVDGAQAAPHLAMDVQALGADFLVFSGHKIYAPTGIGVLWGRADLLNELPPWRGGGEMIKEVTFENTTYAPLPMKLEAGTPNIEGAITLAAAMKYVADIGITPIHEWELHLARMAVEGLKDIPGIRFFGPPAASGIVSFTIEGLHHYDLGTLLDQQGVAVRTGHHCCQPLMARFGITGTTRASFALYNTERDARALVDAVHKTLPMLR